MEIDKKYISFCVTEKTVLKVDVGCYVSKEEWYSTQP